MDRTKTNDVAELTKLILTTFLNIGQMVRYRYQYTLGKELQKDCPAQVNACELAQNRDKIDFNGSSKLLQPTARLESIQHVHGMLDDMMVMGVNDISQL